MGMSFSEYQNSVQVGINNPPTVYVQKPIPAYVAPAAVFKPINIPWGMVAGASAYGAIGAVAGTIVQEIINNVFTGSSPTFVDSTANTSNPVTSAGSYYPANMIGNTDNIGKPNAGGITTPQTVTLPASSNQGQGVPYTPTTFNDYTGGSNTGSGSGETGFDAASYHADLQSLLSSSGSVHSVNSVPTVLDGLLMVTNELRGLRGQTATVEKLLFEIAGSTGKTAARTGISDKENPQSGTGQGTNQPHPCCTPDGTALGMGCACMGKPTTTQHTFSNPYDMIAYLTSVQKSGGDIGDSMSKANGWLSDWEARCGRRPTDACNSDGTLRPNYEYGGTKKPPNPLGLKEASTGGGIASLNSASSAPTGQGTHSGTDSGASPVLNGQGVSNSGLSTGSSSSPTPTPTPAGQGSQAITPQGVAQLNEDMANQSKLTKEMADYYELKNKGTVEVGGKTYTGSEIETLKNASIVKDIEYLHTPVEHSDALTKLDGDVKVTASPRELEATNNLANAVHKTDINNFMPTPEDTQDITSMVMGALALPKFASVTEMFVPDSANIFGRVPTAADLTKAPDLTVPTFKFDLSSLL